MTLIRIGDLVIPQVTLDADALLVADEVLREAWRFGRLAGPRRAALAKAVAAVNEVAAEIVRARRASSGPITGDRGTLHVATPTGSSSPATDAPVWVSTSEAARRLGRTEGHLRWLARQGRLTARRAPGGGWQFDRADVATWEPTRHQEKAGRDDHHDLPPARAVPGDRRANPPGRPEVTRAD